MSNDRRFPGTVIRRFPGEVTRPLHTQPPPPHFPAIADGLWRVASFSFPGFLRETVIELPSQHILDRAKAKLESVGIDDLNKVGDLALRRHLVVNRSGLYAPQQFRRVIARLPHVLPYPNPPQLSLLTAAVTSWDGTESVIVADTFDLNLTNVTITILREHVSHLWIIARRLIASTGAKITYRPVVNPNVGQCGPHGGPGLPDYDRNRRQSSSNFNRAHDGGGGGPGEPGRSPAVGKGAPDLTICVLEMDTMPDIILPGQQGGRGGTGGRGGDGGDGERGRDTKTSWGICSSGPGWGGYGGRGGDGGKGSQGGPGSNGGNVTIATQEDQITPLLTARAFTISNGPGPGGDPGFQGTPGTGGKGGKAGHKAHWQCSSEPHRVGQDGADGQRTGDLGRGDPGSPGEIEYSIITKEEWEEKLHGPWIETLEPHVGFVDTDVKVNGLHLVDGTKVILDPGRSSERTVATSFDSAELLMFRVPLVLTGGEHLVLVRTPGGDTSNTVPFSVKPLISETRMNGTPVNSVAGGDTLSLIGRSFDPNAGVYSNGRPLQAIWKSKTRIDVDIPLVYGEDAGGEMRIVVENPDGLESNQVIVRRLPTLFSGFLANPNGYAFKNFSKGDPTWGCYKETFSADEILGELILHPILTGAFYLFYEWFLSTPGHGHCSGMSATALQHFHQGGFDLHSQYPPSNAEPPPIPAELMRKLDVTQGRVLSRELVTHYADQGQKGISSVENSIRAIESDFRDRFGESTARVLCFIPSGNIWDVFADERTRKAFLRSHCVVPTRIVYPDSSRSLNGAKLYIYDNNSPGIDGLYLDLFEKNGKIHFKYTDLLSSEGGMTLGTATLQKQLLDDVDLPFSGLSATAALMAFVVDLILSPARIRVEDDAGNLLGFKDGKMHSDPNLGYVCPWLENYLLIRQDAGLTRRRIIGEADGKYTYMSFHPNGRSVTIMDALCSRTTDDVAIIDSEFDNVEIRISEDKTLDLHLGEALTDGSVRHVNLSYPMQQNESTKLTLAEGLDGLNVLTPNRDLGVHLVVRVFEGNRLIKERLIDAAVPADKHLEVSPGMWDDVANFQVNIR